MLYDLYFRRHDRINTWDLVDRAAPHVVGGHLFDRPRDTLYELARSDEPLVPPAPRSSPPTTSSGQDDPADTFTIADVLVDDAHDPDPREGRRRVGREAGKRGTVGLREFLDRHAATMPRTTLRYAVEHLDEAQRRHYMGLKKKQA